MTKTTPTSVLVADGQRLFAQSLGRALALEPDLCVVDEFPTVGSDAVDAVLRHRPDVVLYDFWMLGMDGPAAAKAIGAWQPATKVLLLSWFHGSIQVRRALAAGAVGFLPKSLSVDKVVEGIRKARAGDPLVFGGDLARMVDRTERRYDEAKLRWERLMTLSPREVDVLQVLCEGRPAAEVARELSITVGTLKNHIHNILAKTGARTQLEAVHMARHEGLIHEFGPPPVTDR